MAVGQLATAPSALTLTVLLLLAAFAVVGSTAAPSKVRQAGAGDYIRLSCGATRYPSLCVQSLQAFAPSIRRSPRQLATTALAVSVSRARATAAYLGRLSHARGLRGRDAAAVKDCVEIMGDSVDRLSQSIRELGRAGSGSFDGHMSNVQTWVSAALTDETTCLDGFAGVRDPVRAGVRTRVVNVAHVTSNALALVNRYAQRRRA